jgi:hypothetical protein
VDINIDDASGFEQAPTTMQISQRRRWGMLLKESFRRASNWRLLVLQVMVTSLPALIGLIPFSFAIGSQLQQHPQGALWPSQLDIATVVDLLRAISEPPWSRAIVAGVFFAVVLFLMALPWLQGAMLSQARSPERRHWRGLMEGAGGVFFKMVRLSLLGLLPLGAAAGSIAGISYLIDKKTQREVSEVSAIASERVGLVIMVTVVFFSFLMLDVARAVLGARPERRSTFLALCAAVWLMLRNPIRVAFAALLGIVMGLLPAVAWAGARGQLRDGAVVLGLALSTLAGAFLAFGKALRLSALVLIADDDATQREARKRKR